MKVLMQRPNAMVMIVATLCGCMLGTLLSPAVAQYGGTDRNISYRLTKMEQRLARIEKLLRNPAATNARWQKVRDDGARVYLFDTESGRVRIINTTNGQVRWAQ